MDTLAPSSRPRRISRSAIVALAVAIASVAMSGVAYAYWKTSGSGSGSASAGTMTIQVQALLGGDDNASTLIPGGTADVVLRVDNPNAFTVHVSSISAGTVTTTQIGCTTPGVTFSAPQSFTDAQFTLTSGSHLLDLGAAAAMSNLSSNGCQGATFSIPVTVTVQK